MQKLAVRSAGSHPAISPLPASPPSQRKLQPLRGMGEGLPPSASALKGRSQLLTEPPPPLTSTSLPASPHLQSKFQPLRFILKGRSHLLTDLFQCIAATGGIGVSALAIRILG